MMAVSCLNIGDSQTIKANLKESSDLTISQDSVRPFLFLGDDNFVGNIRYGKSYGEILFLFDESRRRIYSVTEAGVSLALDKLGRGPDEYIDISAFTFLAETKELVIFERASRSLRFYIDGAMTRKIDLDFYVNAMEAMETDRIILAKEADYLGGCASLLSYDLSSREQKLIMSLREDQIELFSDVSFYWAGDKMYFGVTGLTTDIYSYSDDDTLQKVASVGFFPNPLKRDYWDGEYDERKLDRMLGVAQGGNGGAALGVFFLNVSESSYSFWFATGTGIYTHNLPDLSLCKIQNNHASIIRHTLTSESSDPGFQPVAMWKGKYIYIGGKDQEVLLEVSL